MYEDVSKSVQYVTWKDWLAYSKKRHDTKLREAIPAKVKLEVTLSYLAAGNNYGNLQQFHRVLASAISTFIPEVCDAISSELNEFTKVRN